MGFPGGVRGKESACQYRRCKRHGSWSLVWEDHLEEEMATHSSILAWKIPRTEEPGRLQSMGLQRVRHDWAHACMLNCKLGLQCSNWFAAQSGQVSLTCIQELEPLIRSRLEDRVSAKSQVQKNHFWECTLQDGLWQLKKWIMEKKLGSMYVQWNTLSKNEGTWRGGQMKVKRIH